MRRPEFLKNIYLAYLLAFNVILGANMLMVFLPIYLTNLSINLVNIGIIYSISALVAGLIRLPVGAWLDRYSKKKMLLFGSLAFPIFSFLIFFVHTRTEFILLKVFVDVLAAMFWTAHAAYLYDAVSKGAIGKQLAGNYMFSMVAAGAAPLIGGFLVDFAGYQYLFLAGGIVSLLALPLVYLLDEIKVRKTHNFSLKGEYLDLLHKGNVRLALMIGFVASIYWAVWGTFLPIYLEGIGVSVSMIGIILAFNMVLCAAAQPLEGHLIDKVKPNYIIIPGFLMISIFGYSFFQFAHVAWFTLHRALVGLGADLAWTPVIADLGRSTKQSLRGHVTALSQAGTTMSFALATFVAGYISEIIGLENTLIGAVGICGIFGVLLGFFKEPNLIKGGAEKILFRLQFKPYIKKR